MNHILQLIHSKYTSRLRRRRFGFFLKWLGNIDTPIRVLDCGGTVEFWQMNGAQLGSKVNVTIVNIFECKDVPTAFEWHVGDVRDLTKFRDREFDVVFSNAVINLMPSWQDQCRMSQEVKRVGKRFFVQSPNRYFPLDWRTLVPFFHFLSPQIQAWCFMHFRVGVYPRVRDPKQAHLLATRVRDLSAAQMRELFPECEIFRERFLGFTKSLSAYGSGP